MTSRVAVVFPGQGSQYIGMGKQFYDTYPEARLVFEESDDTLGFSLSSLIFEGDTTTLTKTENAQPALLTVSIAIWNVFKKEFGVDSVICGAGHSLGEYSALTTSGVLTFKDAVQIVRYRGQWMQEAVPQGEGSMAAVLGLPLEIIEEILADYQHSHKLCVIANDNSPGQVVISGHTQAIEEVSVKVKEAGARRAIPLAVSAPFHSPLMQKAAEQISNLLKKTPIKSPVFPILSNITTLPFDDAESITNLLTQQMTGRVRWRESINAIKSYNPKAVVEIGASEVLCGLIKRTEPDLKCFATDNLESFHKTLDLLNENP